MGKKKKKNLVFVSLTHIRAVKLLFIFYQTDTRVEDSLTFKRTILGRIRVGFFGINSMRRIV